MTKAKRIERLLEGAGVPKDEAEAISLSATREYTIGWPDACHLMVTEFVAGSLGLVDDYDRRAIDLADKVMNILEEK